MIEYTEAAPEKTEPDSCRVGGVNGEVGHVLCPAAGQANRLLSFSKSMSMHHQPMVRREGK